MIYVNKDEYRKLVEHARACLPEEACGLAGGTVDPDGNRRIEKIYLLENTDHSSEHFSLAPGDQLAAVKDMRAKGWKPLGNWHSHPETPARPSQEDIRLAYDSTAVYLILSLMMPDTPVLHAFHIQDGLAEKLDIEYQ